MTWYEDPVLVIFAIGLACLLISSSVLAANLKKDEKDRSSNTGSVIGIVIGAICIVFVLYRFIVERRFDQ
jgi:uncharacterized membrane protein